MILTEFFLANQTNSFITLLRSQGKEFLASLRDHEEYWWPLICEVIHVYKAKYSWDRCADYTFPKLAGCLFTSVWGQGDVRPALDGLMCPEILLIIRKIKNWQYIHLKLEDFEKVWRAVFLKTCVWSLEKSLASDLLIV